MAEKNNGKPTDGDLFDMLESFEGMMRQMVRAGVTYHSFTEHTARLYVNAAVAECGGNYSEAARKITLHRNNVTRILGARKVRAYGQAPYKNGNGHTEE